MKAQNLEINTDLAINQIESYLKELVQSQHSKGILLGLSGGIDSSVLTTIAVRALGKDRVHVSFLFDRDSDKQSAEKAQTMADWLGIKLETQDISPIMQEKKVYAPLIMKLVPYSKRFNRFIQHLYRWINGENPFKTSLKVGSNALEHNWIKRFMFNLSIRHIDNGFSQRHIYRRKVLEQRALSENLTLIGAANLSESKVGWFIKDGIDDLPIQPMTGLYKTQVWQIAAFLKLPEAIQTQLPSPDMMQGITDEFGIGHNYRRLDLILDLIDQGKSDHEILAAGIQQAELDDVKDLMHFSAWKRTSEHQSPPISGEIGGNVRL